MQKQAIEILSAVIPFFSKSITGRQLTGVAPEFCRKGITGFEESDIFRNSGVSCYL